jgi:hypothetical protein
VIRSQFFVLERRNWLFIKKKNEPTLYDANDETRY